MNSHSFKNGKNEEKQFGKESKESETDCEVEDEALVLVQLRGGPPGEAEDEDTDDAESVEDEQVKVLSDSADQSCCCYDYCDARDQSE